MKKHKKHTALTRVEIGEFSRHEWAILGAPCGIINSLAKEITTYFHEEYKIAYIDADHASFDEPQKTEELETGTFITLKNHNVFERIDFAEDLDRYKRNALFQEVDIVLANGNHFTAKQQIVILHEKKLESLQRKIDRLSDVALILLSEEIEVVPDWLEKYITTEVPILALADLRGIFDFLENAFKNLVPQVNGLVLAGGKSTRMGEDKGAINYHGKPQRVFLYEMLDNLCAKTYLSGRKEQTALWEADYPVVTDTFMDLGPMGAILSAFRENPNTAWLCVACDLPLLDKETLKLLMAERDAKKVATSFFNSNTKFPEPLITIWEPKSYFILLYFLSIGYSCPRKVLINTDVKTVQLSNEKVLMNVNTQDERSKLDIKLNE